MKQCLLAVLTCLLFATTATTQTDTLTVNGEKGGLELNKRVPLKRGQEAVIKQGKILSGTVKETSEVGADPNSASQVFFQN